MIASRRVVSLLGVVAWTTTATITVLVILDAVSLSVARARFRNWTIAAGALDALALCCIAVFSTQHAWRKSGITRNRLGARWLSIGCIFVSGVALVFTLVALVIIKRRSKEIAKTAEETVIDNWSGHLAAQFVIWALTFISQATLFSSPLWSRPEKPRQQSFPPIDPRDSVMSENMASNRTTTFEMLEPVVPHSPLAALPSPTFSHRSSKSLQSWRESLQHVVRPVTSRTKLIQRTSFGLETRSVYSDTHSVQTTSQPDGFDMWDTSSVDDRTREAVLHPAPSRGRQLEPIPGSRPASPAHALDGPFPVLSEETEDDPDSPGLPSPPKLYPDTSRPPSPAVGSEANIHPLFRSESPNPPPVATPGTSIVASPLSNHVIACPARPYHRMRSNSRTASPSPLMHSASFAASSISLPNPRASSRSPSPPSRGMTPPIPDFVLNGSPRSSVAGGNGRRKVSLKLDPIR